MDPIARITSNDTFIKLCKLIFAAEYTDFQTIDDSGGDKGNDGYSETERMSFQIYCPEKPDKVAGSDYKTKIKKDLDKAKKLLDDGQYKIEKWVFITPTELREDVQTYIRTEATSRGFQGIAWSSPKLRVLLTKHSNLRSEFPDLILPDIENQIDLTRQEIIGHLDSIKEVEKKYKTDLEQKYSIKIDRGRDMLNAGNYTDAKKEYEIILRDLKNETVEIDKHLFFRTYNNLGVCEDNLGNQDLAAGLYEKAFEAEPTQPMAIAKNAMAKLIKNLPEEALQISENLLATNPNDENGILSKANALYALGRYSDLTTFLKSKNKTMWVNWFQGQEATSRGDFKNAIRFFERVIDLDPENTKAYLYGAQNILMGSKGFLSENPLPINMIPTDLRNDFEKAIRWLQEAIKLLKKRGVKIDLEMAYTNLASCLGGIGLYKESLEAATEATSLDPSSQMAFYNKAVSELKLGKFKEALISFKKVQEIGGNQVEVTKHIAFCALQTNDLKLAEEIIDKEIENSELLDLGIAELAIDIYARKLANEKLDGILKKLKDEFPNDPRAIRARASYLDKIGSLDALPLYELALEKSQTESEKFFAEIDIADALYKQKQYQKAAEIYEKYLDIENNNPNNRNYAVSLFESAQHGKLLKWVKTLKDPVRKDGMIRQSEAYSHWTLNNLEEAGKIFKELYEKDPSSLTYLVYYGMCQFRLGNEKEAKKSYDAIKNLVSKSSDLAILAGGYEFIGERDLAIELTYKGLQNDPHNPKAHLAFIFTFFRREQTTEKQFDEKYIKAFQESLTNFNKKFPEEKALQGFEIHGDDISDILKAVDKVAEVVDTAKNLYQESKLPLSLVVELTGKKPFDVWAAFTNMPEVGIKISFGSEDEMKADITTAEEYLQRPIVIDIYPLFLLGSLGRFDLLEKLFEKIYIHQHILDELTSTIDDLRISSEKGITSLGKIDGVHRITEISPEQVKKSLDMLEKIREFITKNPKCETRGLSKENTEEKESFINSLDDSSKGSILLSKELNIPLYSDDRILRVILRNELNIKCFSTQALIYVAEKNKNISLEERYELQRKMLDLNYDFISIDGLFVYQQLKKENYETKNLEVIIKNLTKKDTSIQSLVLVLSDFIYLLMADRLIKGDAKVEIIKVFLEEAEKNHDLVKIEEGVTDSLQKRIPHEKHDELKRVIKIFFTKR